MIATPSIARRFRGFLPAVVDVECGGFNAATDALLEVAIVLVDMDASGNLVRGATHAAHGTSAAAGHSSACARRRHWPSG